MINETKRKEIRKESSEILERFSKSLNNVKIKEKDVIENEEGFREEGKGEECDNKFRERMFANAPNKEGNFIIAEKREW